MRVWRRAAEALVRSPGGLTGGSAREGSANEFREAPYNLEELNRRERSSLTCPISHLWAGHGKRVMGMANEVAQNALTGGFRSPRGHRDV